MLLALESLPSNLPVKPRYYERFIWDLHKVNVGNLVNGLNSLHWDDDDVDALYDGWLSRFCGTLEMHVPCRTVVVFPWDKPWDLKSCKEAEWVFDKTFSS